VALFLPPKVTEGCSPCVGVDPCWRVPPYEILSSSVFLGQACRYFGFMGSGLFWRFGPWISRCQIPFPIRPFIVLKCLQGFIPFPPLEPVSLGASTLFLSTRACDRTPFDARLPRTSRGVMALLNSKFPPSDSSATPSKIHLLVFVFSLSFEAARCPRFDHP